MTKLINEFCWSKSQDEMFRECRRRYYYARHGAWEGWPGGSGGPQARELYRLKQLKTGRMWLGESVHTAIEQVLKRMRRGETAPRQAALEMLSERMRRDFRNSRAGRHEKDPKRVCRLFEHEYGLRVRDATWSELHDTARRCLSNFFDTRIYRRLARLKPDQWRAVETLEQFDFEGTKLFVKLDCAIATGDGLLIIDWKTGREEDVDFEVQVGTYCLFAMNRWKCPPEKIEALQVELAIPKEIPHRGLAAKAGWTIHYIRNSITAMKAALRDPERNIAEESDFPRVNTPRSCSWCGFKRVCKPPVLEGTG